MILSASDTIKVLEEIKRLCRNSENCDNCEFLGEDGNCVFSTGAEDWKLEEVRI